MADDLHPGLTGKTEHVFLTPPDRLGVNKLSVHQCDICFALVVEDFMPDHKQWHAKLFFGAMA